MFNKVEIVAGGFAVVAIVSALFLMQTRMLTSVPASTTQLASVGTNEELSEQFMTINDIVLGSGQEVKEGDAVTVHYQGRLENGQEFDSSKKRGVPFEFVVGGGQVISGWEQGLVGMKVGGERVLVIPPELAYGDRGIGPIPGGATLTFTIELLAIK